MIYLVGDLLTGVFTGALTALVVHAVTSPGMDMVLAMLIGMGVGMIVHMFLGMVLSPLLGMFHTMIPTYIIGMYGGMLFGMRDSMAAGPLSSGEVALVGGIFGLIVTGAVAAYNAALRTTIFDAEE